MAEDKLETSLENILAYESTPEDSARFVDGVMQEIRGEIRMRRLILALFGVIGALFGVIGAVMLSESIHQLFADALPGTRIMQIVLFVAAALSFYTWVMNDDLALER